MVLISANIEHPYCFLFFVFCFLFFFLVASFLHILLPFSSRNSETPLLSLLSLRCLPAEHPPTELPGSGVRGSHCRRGWSLSHASVGLEGARLVNSRWSYRRQEDSRSRRLLQALRQGF